MNATVLLHVFDQLKASRILVLGDLILDRYTWGNAERISQEAPIVVLHADEQQTLAGGAANVCHLAQGLGAQVRSASVIGEDAAGDTLRQMLRACDVQCDLVLTDPTRPTTVKERFVGRAGGRHPNQILRVDHEVRSPLEPALQEQLIEGLQSTIPDHDVLLISDYGKGVCTSQTLRAAIHTALRHHVLVLVDPARGTDYQNYRGVTLIKPNRAELEQATRMTIDMPGEAVAAGRQLCAQLDVEHAVITLDRDGMAIVGRDGDGEIVPTATRSVYDITGAGDMALAMLGVAIGGGANPLDATRLANVAAGLEVERMGVSVIRPDEIRAKLANRRSVGLEKIVTRDQAASIAAIQKKLRHRVVLTNGCFDLLHAGHVASLSEAAACGDLLIVGMNSDQSIRRLKGNGRPIIGQSDRAAMLAALENVDLVVPFDEDTPHALLHVIRPDVLVKGGSYSVDQVAGHEVVEAYGGDVVVTRLLEGISTTNLVTKIRQQLDTPRVVNEAA